MPERVTVMWENLYVWEKIRELESGLDAARPRYPVSSANLAELARPSVRLVTAAVSRLARALRRGGGPGDILESSVPASHRALDTLLEGRGPR